MSGGIIAESTVSIRAPAIELVVRGNSAGVGITSGDGFDGFAHAGQETSVVGSTVANGGGD